MIGLHCMKYIILIGELIKMKNTNKNENQKSVQSFAYYSRLLKEPFDTVEELNEQKKLTTQNKKQKKTRLLKRKQTLKK